MQEPLKGALAETLKRALARALRRDRCRNLQTDLAETVGIRSFSPAFIFFLFILFLSCSFSRSFSPAFILFLFLSCSCSRSISPAFFLRRHTCVIICCTCHHWFVSSLVFLRRHTPQQIQPMMARHRYHPSFSPHRLSQKKEKRSPKERGAAPTQDTSWWTCVTCSFQLALKSTGGLIIHDILLTTYCWLLSYYAPTQIGRRA